ncbi:MAG TPA: hypothetical protein VGR32_08080 [Brevundimonas sp.]|jgi:hypothetical protein|uniref:hypothetical protein n=1 Tax=Brevundimonas sp. TaxID=1871086 RepID=UPI002DF2F4CB|nr:hypothetical protein [Brevundimonas sp.]
MLISLPLAAALTLAVQDPPPPPAPPAPPERVMIRMHGGPGLDKDGDGFVTRDEFAAPMTDHFGQLDKDGDGRLSTDELQAGGPGEHDVMIRHGGPMVWTGGPIVTGDGERRHVYVMGGPEGGETATWTSEDGREVRVETRIMRGAPGAPPPPPHPPHPPHAPGAPGAPHVFVHTVGGPDGALDGPGDLDANGDGRVTEDEFLAPMREGFRKMDADGSGALEEGERGGADVRVFTRRAPAPAAR